MTIELRVVPDVMAEVADELGGALLRGGPIVLTGGSTVAAYGTAAAANPAGWIGAELWFGDERCVPVDDPRSNYGAVRAELLEPLERDGTQIGYCERMAGDAGPEAGTDGYERTLRDRGIPETGFELFLVGLGPDAHINSMFPSQRTLDEGTRLVAPVPEAGFEPFVPRITLTLPAIALARRVVVVAAGEGKADAVSAAFAEDAPATRGVPASLLGEWAQEVVVLLDDASASRL